MTTLVTKPKVAIKLVPVPKTVLYAGLAGEMVKTLGLSEDGQIAAIQQAVSEGLVGEVIVTALKPSGVRETIRLAMKPPAPGATIDLALEPGKSLLESLDVSLAAAVHYQAELMRRQGLKPEFYVGWSDRARANPAIITNALARLNLQTLPKESPPLFSLEPQQPVVEPLPAPPRPYAQPVHAYAGFPPPPPAYKPVVVAVITPAKDPDVTLTIETIRRR